MRDPVRRDVRRPKPRSAVEISLMWVFARLLDWPVVVGGVIAVVVAAVIAEGVVGWGIFAAVVLLAVGSWWYGRDWELVWRQRRRFERAWRGTPEKSGLAADLGLVNASGVAPKVRRYEVEPAHRRVVFRLPAGITAEAMRQVSGEIADALQAHRANIEKTAPGTVEVTAMDVDILESAKSAEWAKRAGENTRRTLPGEVTSGGGVPFWEADDE